MAPQCSSSPKSRHSWRKCARGMTTLRVTSGLSHALDSFYPPHHVHEFHSRSRATNTKYDHRYTGAIHVFIHSTNNVSGNVAERKHRRYCCRVNSVGRGTAAPAKGTWRPGSEWSSRKGYRTCGTLSVALTFFGVRNPQFQTRP